MTRVTLTAIAEQCGVDVSTVSRALKDDPRVKKPTIERIKTVANALGYRPNVAARMLKEGHSRIIWLVIPVMGTMVDRSICERISLTASKHGFSTAIMLHHESETNFNHIIEQIGGGLGAGVVINRRGISDIQKVKELIDQKFPVIFIDVPVHSLDLHTITTDNTQSSKALTQRLIDAGYDQFFVLFNRENNRVEECRYEGSLDALGESGKHFIRPNRQIDWKQNFTPSGKIAVLASDAEEARLFAKTQLLDYTPEKLGAGCYDQWLGNKDCFDTIVVAEQNYAAIADKTVEQIISQIKNSTSQETVARIPLARLLTL